MSLRQQAGRVVRRVRRATTPAPPPKTIDEQLPLEGEGSVDVRKLLDTYTLEELSEAADEYYRKNLDGVDYYYSKPAANVDEAPDLMICFAQVLAGVRPVQGMRVLDFGAGTGWTSRILTQLGCEVVVCDVSSTALGVARELFERQPVAGKQPAPTFLEWNGVRFDLDDESIDRIFCIDAFHHLPNPAAVLAEMGRVLKPLRQMGLEIDAVADSTDLVILDAMDITAPAAATVHLPHRIPPGFHGNWIPA